MSKTNSRGRNSIALSLSAVLIATSAVLVPVLSSNAAPSSLVTEVKKEKISAPEVNRKPAPPPKYPPRGPRK